MSSETLIIGALTGIAATATMDIVAIIAGRTGFTAGARGEWVGRWYLGMPRGRFAYKDITAVPGRTGEKQAALIGHYVIGIVLAVFYVTGTGWFDLSPDRLTLALGYGFATTVFPWFMVMPCLGFGAFGMAGPPELKLFRTSLVNHISYGLGLWWTSMVLSF